MNLTDIIRSDKDRIDKLLKALRNLDPLSDDILYPALSEYICVRITGYLEVGVDSLLIAFVERSTKDLKLRNIAIQHIKGYHSANYQKIRQLLATFDKELDIAFQAEITKERRTIPADINNLFEARNLIAHGGRTDLGREKLNAYFSAAQKVLEIIADLLN